VPIAGRMACSRISYILFVKDKTGSLEPFIELSLIIPLGSLPVVPWQPVIWAPRLAI